MSDAPDGPGSARDVPMDLVSELLRVVPRFLDRTRSQAELVGSLGRTLPCLGALLGSQAEHPDPDRALPGMHETAEVDVLSVLEAAAAVPAPADPPAATEEPGDVPAATPEPSPTESELPIQDYDSLAASQVVPRLATLSPEELRSVQSYELAHRNRQTILNRVAQRLVD